MKMCYNLCNNYGLAIIFFTLLSKIVLLPLSVWVQKNSIKMVRIQPEINMIKVKFFGDREQIAEEQNKIYKREKYRPMLSLIPTFAQLIVLMAVIAAIKTGMSDTSIDKSFLGLDLTIIPNEARGLFSLAAVAAGLSALLMSLAQNRSNVLQSEQSAWNKYGMLAFSVGLSLYLGWFVQIGVALYWIASNLLSIVQLYALNAVLKPSKYVDYEKLEESKRQLDELEKLNSDQKKKYGKEVVKREKEDYKRFFSVLNKHLVFYSESNGFFKYYRGIFNYIINNTNITIHYITSDPDDKIFEMAKTEPKIKPYYIGEKKLITLMMKMDSDVVVMTMPDIENYHIKRSYLRKDIDYVYVPHGIDSLNMTLRKGALDHYDTVLCIGPDHVEEITKTEEVFNLPKKRLIKCGYALIEEMRDEYQKMPKKENEVKTILIAPSWQKDNIVDSCLEEILSVLKDGKYRIIVRPHPQHVRHRAEQMAHFEEKYADNDNIIIQTDFSSDDTVFSADMLISDWSGIAFEYAFTTQKPVVFINTPMKIMNPDYEKIDTVPLNIGLREKIGRSVNTDELDKLPEIIDYLMDNSELYYDKIGEILNESIYNLGDSASVGAKYIIDSIKQKINERNEKK